MKTLLQKIQRQGVCRPIDMELLRLYFFGAPGADEVRRFAESIDIESERIDFLLLLDHLCRRFHYQGLSVPLRNRLRGVRRFYSTRNTVIMSELVKSAGKLNAAGIPVMLCKGAAIKLGSREHSTRLMLDADIVVPANKFKAASAILAAESAGLLKNGHATDFANGIDLHCVMFRDLGGAEREKGIWARAGRIGEFGVEFLLPCVEDMMVMLLCNELHNLTCRRGEAPRAKWLFDLCHLITRNRIDFGRVAEIARELKVSAQVMLMLRIAAEVAELELPLSSMELKLADELEAGAREIECMFDLGSANAEYDRILAEARGLPVQIRYFLRALKIEFRLSKLRNPEMSVAEFLRRRYQCDSSSQFVAECFVRLAARLRHADKRFKKAAGDL